MVYIAPLDKNDLAQTIRCVIHTFTQEPMSKCLGIDAESYMPFAEIVVQKAIEDRLSLVAKDEKSGDVIGFSILEDFLSELPNFDHIDPRFFSIMNVIEELEIWYVKNYPVKYGEILHIFMTGVDEQHQGKGIAHKLMQETFDVAKNHGYKSIIAECTGVITQHIRAKHGFITLKEIEYKSYLFNGEPVFQGIQEPPSCKLMVKTV